MIGNVWEWTTTTYQARHVVASPCCGPSPAAAPQVDDQATRKALKGGSHLCAPEYCLRYRPAARSPQSLDTSATHIGFSLRGEPLSAGDHAADACFAVSGAIGLGGPAKEPMINSATNTAASSR